MAELTKGGDGEMKDYWTEDELHPDPPVTIVWDGQTFVVPESALPGWLTGRANL